ncbi:hypothetical protein [Rhodovulum sp. PH10]|uniref:hypothetical protein n=1 Tax=Rhodovulum sp. PH10 TaxID=1187851 RepID=UPI00058D1A23|nr:hypothetical protein [Rhodovulum sp. PH10]
MSDEIACALRGARLIVDALAVERNRFKAERDALRARADDLEMALRAVLYADDESRAEACAAARTWLSEQPEDARDAEHG